MSAQRMRLAVAVYGVLAAAAVVWGLVRGDVNLYHHPGPWVALPFPHATLLALALGLAVGLLVVGATRVLVRRATWARQLHVEFRRLLGPLTGREIVVFAVASGIAEELLFRGAMQPSLGLVASSLIFGFVHVGPGKRFLPWTAWATVMGFGFGVLYLATGELLAPIVAHVVINYENLHFIDSYDPTPPKGSRRAERHVPDPELVADRARTGRG